MASASRAVAAPGCAKPRVALAGDAVKALLGAPVLARSPHFVLHGRAAMALVQKLPTETAPNQTPTVDKVVASTSPGLALVVPKRLARRAVTRNLIKRQMRATLRERSVAGWDDMDILIRQRGAFDPTHYRSAASAGLRAAVRRELAQLFSSAGAGA